MLPKKWCLPTAPEVDRTNYLPSARQIQRHFGGLKALRELLGYDDTDFGSGTSRSNIAIRGNLRAKEAERELEQEPSQLFGDPCGSRTRDLQDENLIS